MLKISIESKSAEVMQTEPQSVKNGVTITRSFVDRSYSQTR